MIRILLFLGVLFVSPLVSGASDCPSCVRLESIAKEMKRVSPSTTDAAKIKKQQELVGRASKLVAETLKEKGAFENPRMERILRVIAAAAPLDPRHNVVSENFRALQPQLDRLIAETNRLEKKGALTKDDAVSIKIALAAVEDEFTSGNNPGGGK